MCNAETEKRKNVREFSSLFSILNFDLLWICVSRIYFTRCQANERKEQNGNENYLCSFYFALVEFHDSQNYF